MLQLCFLIFFQCRRTVFVERTFQEVRADSWRADKYWIGVRWNNNYFKSLLLVPYRGLRMTNLFHWELMKKLLLTSQWSSQTNTPSSPVNLPAHKSWTKFWQLSARHLVVAGELTMQVVMPQCAIITVGTNKIDDTWHTLAARIVTALSLRLSVFRVRRSLYFSDHCLLLNHGRFWLICLAYIVSDHHSFASRR